MALQGTIETFALPDVLRLLATSNKTGKLAVDGDRGLGALWVADGAIVASEIDLGTHPSTGSVDVQEGLFQILRFETGEFVFTADEVSDNAGSPHAVEASIAESSTMLDELNQITENVPSITSFVSLSREIDTPEVTLTADQWNVLSSVGGGTTVAGIASEFSFGELDALRRVDDLVTEGVLGVSESSPAPVLADELVDEPNFGGEDQSLHAVDSDAASVDVEPSPFEESSFDEPASDEITSPDSAEMFDDVSTPVVDDVAEEDPFAAPAAPEVPLSDEPVAADPFAPVESAAAEDPFAPSTEAANDPFAAPEVATADAGFDSDAVDPFASVEEATQDSAIEDSAIEDSAVQDSDPGLDPFAPAAGAAAVGATGGVLHDVFGSTEGEPDPGWEPPADEAADHAAAEWPVPNVAGEVDADAPWSSGGTTEEASSQLPPPPAMAPDSFDAPAEESVSQLPPPPAMSDSPVDELDAAPGGEIDQTAGSELPPPPSFDAEAPADVAPAFEAPDAEVSGVASFPEAPVAPAEASATSDTNDMARQLASLSPAAARAVANAAKADSPAAREEALAEVAAEDSSVDRSLLLRFLGKSDKKES